MAKRITVRAPCRIDLAGGWTDVPNFCSKKSGEVVNIAINKYTKCVMEVDDERKITLSYSTDMPTGSGLGTSGSMNVGLIGTILGSGYEATEIAEIAYQFEALLGNKGGRQDQWASALGGINHMSFNGESVETKSLNPSKEFIALLEDRLLLFNSMISHVSGQLHQNIWEKYESGDIGIVQALNQIRDAGLLMSKAIDEESISIFAESFRLVMDAVDKLGMELHDPFRQIVDPYMNSGQLLGWKAMGAGGGGVVGMLLSERCDREKIILDITNKGWKNIDWKMDTEGLQREEITLSI